MFLALALLSACLSPPRDAPPVTGPLSGRVLNLDGGPIAEATLEAWDGSSWTPLGISAADGRFAASASTPARWVRASAEGFLPRVRAARPNEDVTLRLGDDDGETVRMLFAGDTMFGRRYYDPGDDGRPALVHAGTELSDIAAVLDQVAPLLEGADLVSVNLESPLTFTGGHHPTKDYWFTSDPSAAAALVSRGIGFANVANNHLYDYLEDGVESTLSSASTFGLAVQGAGLTEEAAWRPTFLDVGTLRVAFVGCTSITGDDQPLSYVADDSVPKGGAARCGETAITEAVTAARAQADFVVFQVHGGYEYGSEPSQAMRLNAGFAVRAGAGLVVGHHPHVLGGLATEQGTLVAWSLGNFAFDQDLWATFPSAILEVQVGPGGEVRRAFLEPLLLEDYEPQGVRGWLQEQSARQVLSLSETDVALDDGALEWDRDGRGEREVVERTVEGQAGRWSAPMDLRDGWLNGVEGTDEWRLGWDRLALGDFEDADMDDTPDEGNLWSLDAADEWFASEAAHAGSRGLRLVRDAADTSDLVSSPDHRLPVAPGAPLTVYGWVRGSGPLSVQLSWYPSTEGASRDKSTHDLDPTETWTPFQIDTTVPDGIVAVGLYLRLAPPDGGDAMVDLDDLRVVEWTEEIPSTWEACDQIQVRGDARLSVESRRMPER